MCLELRPLCIGVGIGGSRGPLAPHFPGRGGDERGYSPPPFGLTHISTYLKIPPRSLFFHPHNSTVLTPNQSVRCFKKLRGVGTGRTLQAPPCFSSWRDPAHHSGSSFGPAFSVDSDITFCVVSVSQSKNNPRAFQMQEARSAVYFTHYTNLFRSLSDQALARDS